jgi:glycosyltransferase involved in cell wall biosynthesis
MDSLTFVIPAYNDEATIETVIEKTIGVGTRLGVPFDILVTNDASSDSTGSILTRISKKYTNLRIITHTKNAGYGATIKELYQKARHTWLFSLPGDYQIEPKELLKLWVRREEADIIIGWRRARADSPSRLRQSRVYNTLLRILFGVTLHDINSVRLIKTSILQSIHLTTSSAFVDAELVIRSERAGARVIEVPIPHRARAGTGAGGGKLKTILPTVRDMIGFWL